MYSEKASSHLDNPTAFSRSTREIWESSGETRCSIASGKISDTKLYQDILSIRSQTDPRWPDQSTKEDDYSDHYCMYVNDSPVGSLGVTRALDGDMFMQEFFPPQILEEFHEVIASAYRFRILDAYRQTSPRVPGISLANRITREAWREQIAKGTALDIINIEKTHVRYYERMGHILCEGYDYIDPKIGTPSCIMFIPVDPKHQSFISDLAEKAPVVVTAEDVLRCLTRKSVYIRAR